MPRSSKALVAATLFAAAWLLGASTSAHGNRGVTTGAPVAHTPTTTLPTYVFATNDVFDTKWNDTTVSTEVPLSVHGLNYPYTDIPPGSQSGDNCSSGWCNIDASELVAGDYYGLVNVGSGDWQLILFNSDGSVKQVVDSSGYIYLIGADYIFYVGPYPDGTLLVDSPSLNLSIGGSTSLDVTTVSPTDDEVQQALAAQSTLSVPTDVGASGGDTQASVSWTQPSGDDSSITGYEVAANDQTTTANSTTQQFTISDPDLSDSDGDFSTTITGLTDGDAYTFSVAAVYSWGTGAYSDPSLSTDIVAPATTTTMTTPPPPPPTTSTTTTTLAPVDPSTLPTIIDLPASGIVNGSFEAAVSAEDGDTGATSVTSKTTSVCTVNGFWVTYVGIGTCTLDAVVGSTTTYNEATGLDQSFDVTGLTPSTLEITNAPASGVVGGSFQANVSTEEDDTGTKSVTSKTTSVCTVSGLSVTYVGIGTCTLDAVVGSTTTYNEATGSDQSFNVAGLTPSTLKITNLPASGVLNGSFVATVSTDASDTGTKSVTSKTTSVCTTSGLSVQYVGAGTCTLEATVTATSTYQGATGSDQSFNVAKLTPSVLTITNLPTSGIVGDTYVATVSTDSNGVTSVTSITTGACTTSGLSVQYVGTGTCTLEATVAATSTYGGATGMAQGLQVAPAKAVPGATTTTTTTTTTSTTTTTTTTSTLPTTTSTASPASAETTTTSVNQGVSNETTTTTAISSTTPASETTTTSSPYDASPTTTLVSPTTTTTLVTTVNAAIDFCGAPGVSIVNCQVDIAGQGADPGTTVTFDVHSTPTKVGTAKVQPDGTYDVKGDLPANLPIGVHHVVVTGVSLSGSPFTEEEVFTVIAGKRIGAIGWVPPAPLAGDVQFVSTSHRTTVLAATAGATVAAAAVASGVGGGLAFGGGGPTPTGGGSGGTGGSSGGGSLEAVELERFEGETREEGVGDKSTFWRLRGMRFLDRWSKIVPRRASAVSPVLGRILIDGDYLRAMMGSIWIGLCLASIGLGAYASASSGWYAVPPSLGLFLVILALGIFDSTLGFLAGASFLLCSLFAGHIASAPELRLSMGLTLLWFAVPLAAAALRPLRRSVSRNLDAIWERIADLVVCGLFAAWVAEKMTSALSGLSGVELPINRDVRTIVIAVLSLVAVRIVIETVVAHHFPGRLAAVRHEGRLESGRLQRIVSLVAQVVVFVFISTAILGASWALYVGTIVFFTPVVLGLFEGRFPKSEVVAKWKPNGIVTWTLIICTGVLLGELIKHTIHNSHLVEEVGFIILPIPVLIFWTIELFEKKDEETSDEEREETDVAAASVAKTSRATKVRDNETSDQAPKPVGRARARGGEGATSSIAVLDDPVAMKQKRHSKSVTLATPISTSEESLQGTHAAKTRRDVASANDSKNETTASKDADHLLTLRKWAMRVAGVALIVVSVLLVHLQGGG